VNIRCPHWPLLAIYAGETTVARLKFMVFVVILHDQNQLGDNLSGKVKLVEPLPTSLSTQIFPPWSSTNFLAKVNPSPVPSLL